MRPLYPKVFLIAVLSLGIISSLSGLDKISPESIGSPLDSPDFGQTDQQDLYRTVFDPRHKTNLAAQVETPVLKITKKMGDSIKKDEVLIQLDDAIFKGGYIKAKAALEKAKAVLEAKKELYNENVSSFVELKDAEAAVAAAQSDLILAKKNLEASKILAPFDGKVVNVMTEEHEIPKKETSLIEVIDDNVLLAKLLVPSSILNKIHIGQPISIKLNETGEMVPATIKRIGAIIDPASSTLQIEAEIDNSDGKLKTGMTGTAIIQGVNDKPIEVPKPQPRMDSGASNPQIKS
jgi:membrane fusion protein (multidrug efflux system)